MGSAGNAVRAISSTHKSEVHSSNIMRKTTMWDSGTSPWQRHGLTQLRRPRPPVSGAWRWRRSCPYASRRHQPREPGERRRHEDGCRQTDTDRLAGSTDPMRRGNHDTALFNLTATNRWRSGFAIIVDMGRSADCSQRLESPSVGGPGNFGMRVTRVAAGRSHDKGPDHFYICN